MTALAHTPATTPTEPRWPAATHRQRIGIALKPDLLLCAEPVFVAHDLSIVRHVSDEVAVIYLGKVVETGTHTDVYEEPAHPYSRALLSAEPGLAQHRGRRSRIVLAGDPPSLIDPPPGCRFHPRCWMSEDACTTLEPPLATTGSGDHRAACHFAGRPTATRPDRREVTLAVRK